MNEKEERRGSGRVIVVALVVAVVGTLALIAYLDRNGGTESADGAPASRAAATAATATPPSGGGAAPVDGSVHDRAARDAVRKRILDAWAQGGDETRAEAARSGHFPPMPQSADGGIDPGYIREVVRTDLLPLVKGCYEEMLTRKDAGGRLITSFKIVGDEKVGGIVEEAEIEAEGGLDDEKLLTCVRESTMSLAFRPPPGGGWVTVKYPMVFSTEKQ